MTNATKFARPYARAAFDYAQEQQRLESWADMLRTLSERVLQPAIVTILKDPRYNTETRCEMILTLGQDVLDDGGRNFIKTLADNHRLSLLPDIYRVFEQLRAAIDKTLHVQVKCVVTLNETQSAKLQSTLSRQLGRPVTLEYEIDPDLLGGFVAYAGDRVIDGSVRGQLERLRDAVVG